MDNEGGYKKRRERRIVDIGGYLVKVQQDDRYLKVYKTDEANDLFDSVGKSAFRLFIYMCAAYMDYERNTIFISPSRKKELLYRLEIKAGQLMNLLTELEQKGLLELVGHGEYYANGYCVGFGKISVIKTDKKVDEEPLNEEK